jgi:hypothetical protein
MTRPDFLIIGAQRCGTTSLFDVLSRHPDIRGAKRKEVHYFDHFFQNGPVWYDHFFGEKKEGGRTLYGEATPMYLFHPHVPQRVHDHLPNVKLIVLLRDPVDRAYSHYMLERKRGDEPLPTFREAVMMEDERTLPEKLKLLREPDHVSHAFKHHTYMQRGLYGEQLLRWTGLFPLDQFLILRSEDVFMDPRRHLAKVFDFLDISHSYHDTYPILNKKRDKELSPDDRKELSTYFTEDGKLLRSIAGQQFSWT